MIIPRGEERDVVTPLQLYMSRQNSPQPSEHRLAKTSIGADKFYEIISDYKAVPAFFHSEIKEVAILNV